jgi:hypothetical protein
MPHPTDRQNTSMQPHRQMLCDHSANFCGFMVRTEDITRSSAQLHSIESMSDIDKQLAGTLTDTESAIGYFRNGGTEENQFWTCYRSVKMKQRGLVVRFAKLVGANEPSLTRNWNTLTESYDFRWSKQIQGLVAFSLLLQIRPFLYNEKSTVEADCIIHFGPTVRGGPHPFVWFGGATPRRCVWHGQGLKTENLTKDETSTAIK